MFVLFSPQQIPPPPSSYCETRIFPDMAYVRENLESRGLFLGHFLQKLMTELSENWIKLRAQLFGENPLS